MGTIAILGGYGYTGSQAANFLAQDGSHDLVIAGRNWQAAKMFADQLGARALTVDLDRPRDLEALCDTCDLIINCTGPSRQILDRVASAAWPRGVHYVDPGGDSKLFRLLEPRLEEIRRIGVRMILSAGVFPGLSELFILDEADRFFDRVEDLEFYHMSVGTLSPSAAYDILASVTDRDSEYISAGSYFKNGRQVKDGGAKIRPVTLPDPAGTAEAYPVLSESLARLIRAKGIPGARAYDIAPDKAYSSAMLKILMSGQYHTEEQRLRSATTLARATRNPSASPLIMFHMILKGLVGEETRRLTVTLAQDNGYRLTGTVAAIAAKDILKADQVPPGCGFVEESLSPRKVMETLESRGCRPLRHWN